MAKGDDFKAKKKNKALRKKLSKDPAASVSARVASIIAAKKRRHSGKRRQCQGMCFSLPTPEDPFNDQQGKEDPTGRKTKKPISQTIKKAALKDGADVDNNKPRSLQQIKFVNGHHQSLEMDEVKRDGKELSLKNSGCPSKFLFNCLNSIQDSLVGDGEIEEQEKSFIVSTWGFEFWKAYSHGKDMLECSGNSPSVRQIAWMASTSTDSIQQKECEQNSLKNPFLLYLIPSKEKAIKVRSVCKPLKAFGIHTVCLHSGASVEHQVDGLKSCDPEFLVATPERLWELASLKAIDISGVTLLIVDGVESLSGCLDVVKSIRDSISGNFRMVVFQGRGSSYYVNVLQKLLRQPMQMLSSDE